jgi:predicted small metal-binding protein
MTKHVKCDCGKTIREDSDDRLVESVQEHAKEVHGMDLTREQVMGMARPV